MIADGKLLEWGKYKGHFYGTPKVSPIDLDPNRRFERSQTFKVRSPDVATMFVMPLPHIH